MKAVLWFWEATSRSGSHSTEGNALAEWKYIIYVARKFQGTVDNLIAGMERVVIVCNTNVRSTISTGRR